MARPPLRVGRLATSASLGDEVVYLEGAPAGFLDGDLQWTCRTAGGERGGALAGDLTALYDDEQVPLALRFVGQREPG